jgi:hypothetical protein
MIPRERGLKVLSLLLLFLYTHIGFNSEKRLHELPGGKAMWFLISCNYINTSCGLFGGSFTFAHSLFLIHS